MKELVDDRETAPAEPVADMAREPVEAEMVLLEEPASVNVADVVEPEAPMVADAAAPVPRTTSPVAVRAPFTVVGAVRVRLEASTVKEYVAADKTRGPVDVEIVLLVEAASVKVADVVVPEAPMVVNAAVPVPRATSPAAVRAPFTVVPVEDERAIRLVASVTPIDEPFICTPLMSTKLAPVDRVMEPAVLEMTEAPLVRESAAAAAIEAPPVIVARPDTPRVPATETPVELSESKLVAAEMPMVVPVALIRTPLMSTYLAEAVADSEMVELADDKVRGPVEVEMLLLTDPLSANVADVVVPEAPMVADAAAPVPRRTAPVAVKAPFTVALVEERAIRLVAPDTPMFVPEVPTRTPLMSI